MRSKVNGSVANTLGKRIMIVAGEASGDTQAALLVRSMLRCDPELCFYGVGGDDMRAAGVRVDVDASELSMMGFTEVVAGIARAWRCYRQLARQLRSGPAPDMVILVDFPEFNLVLARVAARAGVKVFYYVSPQVWAWRRGRVRKIARRVTRMVVLFPFEKDIYKDLGVDVHFVGHPLAETVTADRRPEETRALYGLSGTRPLVALLPGSRKKEVEANFPVMLEAAHRLREEADFIVARAPGLDAKILETELLRHGDEGIVVATSDTYNVVSASDAVLVTSGTATVECALLSTPMVVVYRMSALSYLLARLLVRTRFIAMPNIILGKRVVPELVQGEATAENVAMCLRNLLEDRVAATVRGELAAVRESVVRPGAAASAAALAMETLS